MAFTYDGNMDSNQNKLGKMTNIRMENLGLNKTSYYITLEN